MRLNDYTFDASDYQNCIDEVVRLAKSKEVRPRVKIQKIINASLISNQEEKELLKELVRDYIRIIRPEDCLFCSNSTFSCKLTKLLTSL